MTITNSGRSKWIFGTLPVHTVTNTSVFKHKLYITIAHDLSPSLHIGEIAAKAHQRANCILRCFLSGDANLIVRAFIVYKCKKLNSLKLGVRTTW